MHGTLRTLALAGTVALLAATTAAAEQPMTGEPAPDFRLESLDGDTGALSDFRGDYVVLHFGAGW